MSTGRLQFYYIFFTKFLKYHIAALYYLKIKGRFYYGKTQSRTMLG